MSLHQPSDIITPSGNNKLRLPVFRARQDKPGLVFNETPTNQFVDCIKIRRVGDLVNSGKWPVEVT